MCSASPPPPPDVIGQANAQGAANRETALAQGHINNPNIVGPGMSRTITWDGETPTITTNLSPEELDIYNQNVANRGGMGQLAGQGIDSLHGIVGKPLDLSGVARSGSVYTPDGRLKPSQVPDALNSNLLPKAPNAYRGGQDLPGLQSGEDVRSRVIGAMLQRSNDQINKQQDQTQSDLIARGLRPGTEAYKREMDAIGRQRNDAMAQAEVAGGNAAEQAFGMDAQRRQQFYGEGIGDANLAYQQGMGLRTQAQGEQGQRFGQVLQSGAQNFNQQGQASQLSQSQQAQANAQQSELRRQQIAELITQRQMPLNEITALMSGGQTNGAQGFQGGGSGPGFNPTNIAPPPIFAANQAGNQYGMDVYNAETGTANQRNSAMAQAAITAISMY